MEEKELNEILELLNYSWKDINYNYDELTETEKSLISRETFKKICKLLK